MSTHSADLTAWAASGAMALTGPRGGAPSPAPAPLASAMEAAAEDLARQTARWGTKVTLDGPALLGERAAFTGMTRNGDVSVGGAARFLRAADGWVVLNLPRPDDVAALPALVGAPVAPDDWPSIAARLAEKSTAEIVETGSLLGLAVAAPATGTRPVAPGHEVRRGGPRTPVARPLVVDLTALWAGPLLTSALVLAGARVVKVEGRGRPDGARNGPRGFFDLLNAGKECITIDFGDLGDLRLLHRLLRAADLVVEASRPRVMQHIGVDPAALVDAGVNWLSVTGHGRAGVAANRVAFGDDAAVAGGLFVAGDPPAFVADAVADPVAGLAGAALAAELLADGRAALMEVPLARAAAWAARPPVVADVERRGPQWVVDTGEGVVEVADPRHRPVGGSAREVGADDAAVRAEFGPGRPAPQSAPPG